MTAPAVLLVLAMALAGPAPALLGRARWPVDAPRAALVLWQALALSALLSALGAGASAATLALTLDHPGLAVFTLTAGALALTALVTARLLWSAHTLGTTLRAGRRRQRRLVDLVGQDDARAPGARVLDATRPVAYCIPGLRSRLVVSAPAVDSLAPDELSAVLTHERAHARARHDLVLEGFAVLHNAFPRLARGRVALDTTAGLVEMLADDVARRRTGAVPLARALAQLAAAPVPAGALGSAAVTPVVRIRRLAERRRGSTVVVSALAYLTAVALVSVPTVTVALPWLTNLLTALAH